LGKVGERSHQASMVSLERRNTLLWARAQPEHNEEMSLGTRWIRSREARA
jgi:hypothetical protein